MSQVSAEPLKSGWENCSHAFASSFVSSKKTVLVSGRRCWDRMKSVCDTERFVSSWPDHTAAATMLIRSVMSDPAPKPSPWLEWDRLEATSPWSLMSIRAHLA